MLNYQMKVKTRVGLKFLREVLIGYHRSQCSPLRVFSAFKNVTKVFKLRGGTFAGLTKVLKLQSFLDRIGKTFYRAGLLLIIEL